MVTTVFTLKDVNADNSGWVGWAGLGWLGWRLAVSGWFWLALAGSGWFWLVLAGSGWLLVYMLTCILHSVHAYMPTCLRAYTFIRLHALTRTVRATHVICFHVMG